MNNIFSSFADTFKPASELVFSENEHLQEDETVNVLLACMLNGFFPHDSILAVIDNLTFKDKLNHQFFVASSHEVVCVTFGALQNTMTTTRFQKDPVTLRKKCSELEKSIDISHKILFGLDVMQEPKSLFKGYHICDLSDNHWWSDLQNVGPR
jgi:hypothetical protein